MTGFYELKQMIANILALGYKELKSLLSDIPLIVMIVVVLTFVIVNVFHQVALELKNASVGIIDEDHSALSGHMIDALRPPYFKHAQYVDPHHINEEINNGKYIFTVHFPHNFEKNILSSQPSKIQLLVDATSVTQAGIGTIYIQRLFMQALLQFYKVNGTDSAMPIKENTRVFFDRVGESGRYSAVMQLVMDITLLSLILVGSAVIREKEHGTIEHLLVMPVNVLEIALAKIIANGLVILIAAMASLYGVLHWWLGVDINGSFLWILVSCWAYIFAATSVGMFLATLTPSTPQFGLIVTPLIMVTHFTSGGASPVEAMSPTVQTIVKFLPTTHFVYNVQDLIFRGSGFSAIFTSLLILLAYGLIFFALALLRFRTMLQKQN